MTLKNVKGRKGAEIMGAKLDLNEYLGREIACNCGHVHVTTVKKIDIDQGATQSSLTCEDDSLTPAYL